MKTCKEMASIWNVTERTVTTFCKTGKISGAIKVGKSWQIPEDAEKPVDGRISSGKYIKKSAELKSLPIGISDYVRAQSEYYYVDKTLLIKEFLDRKPLVSLFTRPRRFGKTLNMDMLRVFFEISEEDTSKYFRDKAIWKCGDEYRSHQGSYPVVWGKRIYENVYGVEPIIMQVDKDTLLIRTGRGDSWITKFVNGKTNRVSDDFENISAYNGQLVVYGIYEDEQLKIVIRDIYDKDKVYKEVIDTFPNVAVGSYIIKDAQIIDEHSVDLTYYVGDEWEEKEEVVLLD